MTPECHFHLSSDFTNSAAARGSECSPVTFRGIDQTESTIWISGSIKALLALGQEQDEQGCSD